MTDYSKAACLGMEPEEFTDSGTPWAHQACRVCPVRLECRIDAERAQPPTRGVYRGGKAFPDHGKDKASRHRAERPREQRADEWLTWLDLWRNGWSYKAIGKRFGKHHTTVMAKVKQLHEESA